MREFLPLALILSVAGSAPQAQSLDQIVRLDVIPGWETQRGTHMAGLRVTLAPGWKTYWRAPGDAGIPPQFSFAGSDNIAGAQFHWPVPQVFETSGMRSIGYHDGVVIPVELTPTRAGEQITLAGEVSIGICEEICVPASLTFAAVLPPDGTRDSAITASLINQPISATEAGIAAVTCSVASTDHGMQITATIPTAANGTENVIIEAGDPYVWVSEPAVSFGAGQIVATAQMAHAHGDAFALDRSAVRFTILGVSQAIDIQGCVGG